MGPTPNNKLYGGDFVMPRGPAHIAKLAISNARNMVDRVTHLVREVSGLNIPVQP